MAKDLWEEICFILTETIPSNVSEQIYENKVIRVFEKLGWSQYKKELSVRESIQFGAANRMCPDIIIRNERSEVVCVIEIKKPSEDLNFSGHINQLSSYMRMLRSSVGILIGNRIKVYTEKPETRTNEIHLLEEIPLKSHSEKGVKFVETFKKSETLEDSIEAYIHEGLKKHRDRKKLKELENRINDPAFSDEIFDMVKSKLNQFYEPELVERVLENFSFEVLPNQTPLNGREVFQPTQSYSEPNNYRVVTDKRTKNGLKIGAYVQKTFRELFSNNRLNSNDIHALLDPDYSKRVFNAGYPVLRNVSQGRTDHKGYNRYYREVFGNKYLLCSQWNVTHWDQFENWVKEVNRKGMP